MIGNKNKFKKPSSKPFLLRRLNFATDSSISSSPQWHRGMGNGGCGQFITHCLCRSFFPHTVPLLQHRLQPTRSSHPRTSSMWVLHMDCSSSQTAAMQVLSTGCSSSGTYCSNLGPPWGHRSCQQTVVQCGLLSMRPRSFQESAPASASHGVTASFREYPPAPAWDPSRSRWISAPVWTSMGYRGTACVPMVFTVACRENLCSGSLSPPSLLTLVSARLFLSCILTLLS